MNWNVDYKHVTEKEEDQILWCCSEPSLTDCSSPELSDLIEVLISKSNMTWLQSPFLSLSLSLCIFSVLSLSVLVHQKNTNLYQLWETSQSQWRFRTEKVDQWCVIALTVITLPTLTNISVHAAVAFDKKLSSSESDLLWLNSSFYWSLSRINHQFATESKL